MKQNQFERPFRTHMLPLTETTQNLRCKVKVIFSASHITRCQHLPLPRTLFILAKKEAQKVECQKALENSMFNPEKKPHTVFCICCLENFH